MSDKPKGCDELIIEDLQVFANHGVYPEETKLGQKFLITMHLYMDTLQHGEIDDLNHMVDYGRVCSFVSEYMKKNTFKLIESAAEQTAAAVLREWPVLKGLTLELKKPWAPVGLPLGCVSVRISRYWHKAYVALGSNIGDREQHLRNALGKLHVNSNCRVGKMSKIIETKPFGGVEQDDFLNACLELYTLLTPAELLKTLHHIENYEGRKRDVHWGPRTLDLDLLFYDDEIISTPDLTVPHPGIPERDFVLRPMAEIAPALRHPVLGKTISELLAALEK